MNSWLDQKEYPFNSNYFNVNGHQMHYIDEGQGETILFIHGTPSWSFDFRNVIKSLSKNYRCIAIDHVGFGLSDKPEFYDYSTQNHSWTLEKFVLELGLKNITLVLHDFGGPIGLDFAIRNSQLIKRITVLNSWLWSSEGDPKYLKLKRILKSPLLPFLYKYLNFSAKYILPSSFGDNKLSTKMKAQFTRPFENRKQRNGTLAFAHSLLNDQEWFEQLWNQRSSLSQIPILFVWGMKDPVLGHLYLEKFSEGFPNSMTVEIETAGHFPQEEQPMQVAEAIKLFLAEL
ncbi:MAG: alpha/beta fold hydrolase [Saprospiraceae bacterium]|nr:alpha/beta fold hydrolase [Candidatus Brachybacter algidus]